MGRLKVVKLDIDKNYDQSTPQNLTKLQNLNGGKSCEICGRYFARNYGYTMHMKAHFNARKIECPTCTKKFMTNANMKRHSCKVVADSQPKPFKCISCEKHFTTITLRDIHQQKVHKKPKEYICRICGKISETLHFYIKHKRTHIGETFEIEKNGTTLHGCGNCKACFTSEEFLKDHIFNTYNKSNQSKSNLEKNEFSHKMRWKCFDCTLRFTTVKELKLHMKEYPDHKNSYCKKCSVCSKMVSNQYYKGHMLAHKGIKLYSCHICSAKYSQYSYLKLHFDCHVKVKKYECSICKKLFVSKSRLISHKQIHKMPQSCKCKYDGCSLTFDSMRKRQAHYKYKHGAVKIPCLTCGFMITNWYMGTHVSRVHAVNEVLCDHCGISFKNPYYLKCHINSNCVSEIQPLVENKIKENKITKIGFKEELIDAVEREKVLKDMYQKLNSSDKINCQPFFNLNISQFKAHLLKSLENYNSEDLPDLPDENSLLECVICGFTSKSLLCLKMHQTSFCGLSSETGFGKIIKSFSTLKGDTWIDEVPVKVVVNKEKPFMYMVPKYYGNFVAPLEYYPILSCGKQVNIHVNVPKLNYILLKTRNTVL